MNLPLEMDFITNNKGWSCPLCNAVMAPTYPTCWYCRPNNNRETLQLCQHNVPVKFNNCVLCKEIK